MANSKHLICLLILGLTKIIKINFLNAQNSVFDIFCNATKVSLLFLKEAF